MLKLLASAPEDGWAFVIEAGATSLVRPPYRGAMVSPAPPESVAVAVRRYGFQAEDRTFQDWASLVEHLKLGITRARAAKGEAVPSLEKLGELLQQAPESVLVRFLDRVEGELLPEGEWRPAQNILIRLLSLPGVRDNPALLERATDALGRADGLRERQEAAREKLVAETFNLRERFPLVAKHYQPSELAAWSREISQRGQVIFVGDG
jgi:hypothetical protein